MRWLRRKLRRNRPADQLAIAFAEHGDAARLSDQVIKGEVASSLKIAYAVTRTGGDDYDVTYAVAAHRAAIDREVTSRLVQWSEAQTK